MAGAWEIGGPSVFVGILTREMVTAAWANAYRNLQLPQHSAIGWYAGMPFDHARNNACQDALNGGFEWLFFLDDDIAAPSDTVLRLMQRKQDIISGLYYRRHDGVQPCMQAIGGGWITEVPFGQVIEVGLVGAGCLLIHRRVLETMKERWFEWLSDRKDLPENQRFSEDFAFCVRARQAGFKVLVDTTIHCKHLGIGQAEVGGRFIPAKII